MLHGQKFFSRPIFVPNAGHILSTIIKLPLVIKIFVLSILSGRLRQVILYVHQVYTG